MNQKLKYVGLLAILPLFTMAFPSAVAAGQGPSLAYIGTEQFADGDNTNEYLTTFRVFAGDKDVLNVQILVKSDIDAVQIVAEKNSKPQTSLILAGDSVLTSVKLMALSPGSITIDILDFQEGDMKVHSKELQRQDR